MTVNKNTQAFRASNRAALGWLGDPRLEPARGAASRGSRRRATARRVTSRSPSRGSPNIESKKKVKLNPIFSSIFSVFKMNKCVVTKKKVKVAFQVRECTSWSSKYFFGKKMWVYSSGLWLVIGSPSQRAGRAGSAGCSIWYIALTAGQYPIYICF